MKRFLFIIITCAAAHMISCAQRPLDYDTIIDRGIYKSYFNTQYGTVSFVRYKLWKGGGKVKRTGLSLDRKSVV